MVEGKVSVLTVAVLREVISALMFATVKGIVEEVQEEVYVVDVVTSTL